MNRRPLSEDQIEKSRTAPKFETVKPEDIAGPRSNSSVALRVFRENPARYRELVQQYLWDTGAETPPPDYYDRRA